MENTAFRPAGPARGEGWLMPPGATSSAPDVEIAVVGGGVVGLAIARALSSAGRDVLLIERNARAGAETSSRSSEVIHAGLYYPPGSLRAALCVEGRKKLYAFAAESGVPVKRWGKLVVATRPEDLAALASLAARAAANGVDDLQRLTAEEARAREPALACSAALYSPSTGVVDSGALMQTLAADAENHGAVFAFATAVTRLERSAADRFTLSTERGGVTSPLTAAKVVIAAGHGASALGRTLEPLAHGYSVPATYPARGHYFSLKGRAPFRHLVYPMPDANHLGIHLTLDVAGAAKFGPDLEWCADCDTRFDDPDQRRRARFEAEIRRYWPGLPDDALAEGYVGVRPKIYRAGEPVPDFAIHTAREHGAPGLVALYGIESPGLTASLAIADLVARLIA